MVLSTGKIASARIVVIGLPGAGKTHFAREFSALTGIRHIELDHLYWEDRGKTFRSRVQEEIQSSSWIVEGHFTKVSDLLLPRAELILFLDYPLPLVFWRWLKRAITGSSHHGTLGWLIRNHRHSRRAFADAVTTSNIPSKRFTSPAQARRFLHELG